MKYKNGNNVNGYTISIGRGKKMFTLRYRDPETNTSEHIVNLGSTREIAEKKAFERTGYNLKAPSLYTRKRAGKTPDDKVRFKSGKHKGELLTDVIEYDLSYIIWWISEDEKRQEYEPSYKLNRYTRLALNHPRVIAERERIEKDKRERREAIKRKALELEAKKGKLRKNSKFVGNIGDRETFTCVVEKVIDFPDNDSLTYLTILLDKEENEICYWGLISMRCPDGEIIKAWDGNKIRFNAGIKKQYKYDGISQTIIDFPTKCEMIEELEDIDYYTKDVLDEDVEVQEEEESSIIEKYFKGIKDKLNDRDLTQDPYPEMDIDVPHTFWTDDCWKD